MSEKRLIVGLGNPGKKYEWTRHNLGYLALGALAQDKFKIKFKNSSFTNALMTETIFEDSPVFFLLPQTYMNNSGMAVARAVHYWEIDLDGLLVVCDDFNLDFGQIRVRPHGSSGGHNGLSSLIEHLGTDQFPRLRLGIGYPPTREKDSAQYVLEEFNKEEKKQLGHLAQEAAECCLSWLKDGITKAMERYNKKWKTTNS